MRRLAFLLLRYFPHGGQQRDFMRIALACQQRGHDVRVYTSEWQGETPNGFDVRIVKVSAWRQHQRYPRFAAQVKQSLAHEPVDCVIGFNRLAGLDLYFAADPCFAEKACCERGLLYRLTARYRQLLACEQAVFSASSATQILLLSELQRVQYLRHYAAAVTRMQLLPPGLSEDRRYPEDAPERRQLMRERCQLHDTQLLLLQVGSGFAIKGVERSVRALAALPLELRSRCRLVVVGDDRAASYQALARSLAVAKQCQFVGASDQVADWMLAADLLLHPAISESAGHVLLEALVYGLPVLTTDSCGYASHVKAAEAGWVCASPFRQSALNVGLQQILQTPGQREIWRDNARHYCEENDLYGLAEAAVQHIERTVFAVTAGEADR